MNKLLKFSRVGCNPCVALGNFLKGEGIPHDELDVDDDLELTTKYGIGSVPTLILIDEDGEVLDRAVGFNPPQAQKMADQL